MMEQLPIDPLEWTQYDINEALEEELLEPHQLDEDCDLIYVFVNGSDTFWIQRIFSGANRVHEYYTLADQFSESGSFRQCVNLLNRIFYPQ